MKRFKTYLTVLLFCLMVVPAHAGVILMPTADTFVDSLRPNSFYLSERFLRLKKTESQTINALIQYNLSPYISALRTDNTFQINLILNIKSVTHAGAIEIRNSKASFSEVDTGMSGMSWANSMPGLGYLLATIPITSADIGKRVSIDITNVWKIAAIGSNRRDTRIHVLELHPINGLEARLYGRNVNAQNEIIDLLGSGLELISIGESSFIPESRIADIETKNTAQDSSVSFLQTAIGAQTTTISTNTTTNVTQATDITTNTTNISINAAEILQSTIEDTVNKNKDLAQDTQITTNTTTNVTQTADITAVGTKNTEQDNRLTNLRDMVRFNTSSIGTNATKNGTQDTGITSNTTKNTAQDTSITSNALTNTAQDNSITTNATKNGTQDTAITLNATNISTIELTPGPQGIAGDDGSDSTVAGPTGPRGPSGSTNLKKWAYINGRPATPVFRVNNGFGSVVRSGHRYTFNYSPNMPNSNYVVTIGSSNGHCFISAQTAAHLKLYCLNTSGQPTVADFLNVVIIQ